MPIITSIDGKKKNIKCISCALQKSLIQTKGGIIFNGKHFEIRQDYEVSIPGFFVISSKRHIVGFADFTGEEKQEFIDLLCKLRKGMKEALKIEFVDLLFREDIIKSKINPSHFHIALLPKQKWMNRFSGYPGILDYAKKKLKAKSNLRKIDSSVNQMKKYLS